VVHAIDPDRDGKILWQVRIGKGGVHGGIQWGSAADGSNIYVALSDATAIPIPFSQGTEADPNHGGRIFALKLATGERVWAAPTPKCGDRKRCCPAQSAAVTAIPGAAFSGSLDGHLRAYSTKDGTIIWDFDTVGPYGKDFLRVKSVVSPKFLQNFPCLSAGILR
jgi:polyvinyl alcohol dehydrogenase (cytochrome)